MNFYEFKYHSGETDWIFAPSKKEAKKFYLSYSGCGDLDDYIITRIPKKEWSENYILDIGDFEPDDDDHNEDDYCNGYKIEMTFKEYAEKNKFTDMVATTEF